MGEKIRGPDERLSSRCTNLDGQKKRGERTTARERDDDEVKAFREGVAPYN